MVVPVMGVIVLRKNVQGSIGSLGVISGHSLAHALVDAGDGRERVEPQLQVKVAAAQVVHYAHLVPTRAEVQGRGPAAVAVAAWGEGEEGFGSSEKVGDREEGNRL